MSDLPFCKPGDTAWLRQFADLGQRDSPYPMLSYGEADAIREAADEIEQLRRWLKVLLASDDYLVRLASADYLGRLKP